MRVLCWFACSGLIESDDVREILARDNSGFSLDSAACVAANDRAGLERRLRCCARLPFALGRLELIDAQRVAYRLPQYKRGHHGANAHAAGADKAPHGPLSATAAAPLSLPRPARPQLAPARVRVPPRMRGFTPTCSRGYHLAAGIRESVGRDANAPLRDPRKATLAFRSYYEFGARTTSEVSLTA